MKTVFLTIGPRSVGKTTFCQKLLKVYPQAPYISRDAIMMEMFGSIYGDPYTGDLFYAIEEMFKRVGEHLNNSKQNLILDCWTGFPQERCKITAKLRELGAEKIIGWHFVTPQDVCLPWVMARSATEVAERQKNKDKLTIAIIDYSEANFKHDYDLFHSYPVNKEQGFDQIIKLDSSNQADIAEMITTLKDVF